MCMVLSLVLIIASPSSSSCSPSAASSSVPSSCSSSPSRSFREDSLGQSLCTSGSSCPTPAAYTRPSPHALASSSPLHAHGHLAVPAWQNSLPPVPSRVVVHTTFSDVACCTTSHISWTAQWTTALPGSGCAATLAACGLLLDARWGNVEAQASTGAARAATAISSWLQQLVRWLQQLNPLVFFVL